MHIPLFEGQREYQSGLNVQEEDDWTRRPGEEDQSRHPGEEEDRSQYPGEEDWSQHPEGEDAGGYSQPKLIHVYSTNRNKTTACMLQSHNPMQWTS